MADKKLKKKNRKGKPNKNNNNNKSGKLICEIIKWRTTKVFQIH